MLLASGGASKRAHILCIQLKRKVKRFCYASIFGEAEHNTNEVIGVSRKLKRANAHNNNNKKSIIHFYHR